MTKESSDSHSAGTRFLILQVLRATAKSIIYLGLLDTVPYNGAREAHCCGFGLFCPEASIPLSLRQQQVAKISKSKFLVRHHQFSLNTRKTSRIPDQRIIPSTQEACCYSYRAQHALLSGCPSDQGHLWIRVSLPETRNVQPSEWRGTHEYPQRH